MDFFEHQAKAKKKTFVLVAYFLLAIIFIIAAIDAVVIGALLFVGWEQYIPLVKGAYPTPSTGNIKQDLIIIVSLIVSPIVMAFILIGSLIKIYTLRQGGISVAEMVNATPLSLDTKDPLQKRFLNVVEEMSIASGIPIPKLYIMEKEFGINAFVAGFKPEDTVMVVTQGALEQLNRDELQGVIGHEFSHIFNSDMQINLRLIGILGGLLVIGQTGYFLLRSIGRTRTGRSRSDGRLILVMITIGLGFFIIGYIGLFFGRLIKAAVSRQRELLADAQSVQYSRHPAGLVNALRRIQQSETGTYLESKNAEDVSHICFCSSRGIWLSSLLATHPPIETRIKILDPKNQYGLIKSEKKTPPPAMPKKSTLQLTDALLPILAGDALIQSDRKAIQDSIGEPSKEHLQMAQQLIALIPEELLTLSHDKESVPFVLYAMIAPKDKEKIKQILKSELTEEAIDKVCQIQEKISSLPRVALLPLLEIALTGFKANPMNVRQRILQTIENLMSFNGDNLFQFALHAMINKATNGKMQVQRISTYKFDEILSDVSVLMALVLQYSHKDKVQREAYFLKIMTNFTKQLVNYPDISKFSFLNLQALLARLNQLSPLFKEKIIQSSFICIEDDNKITAEEAEFVRAIASCLDCPIPPLIPTL